MKKLVIDHRVESLAWLLALLLSYSIIGFYVSNLLDTYGSEGWVSHVLALFAVLLLGYGIFSGRRMKK